MYFKLATNANSHFPGKCKCTDPTTHKKDWWGRDEAKAIWREKVFQTITESIARTMAKNVRDIVSPPSSIRVDTLPTDARIAQKERLAKMKELGFKPKKKAIHFG